MLFSRIEHLTAQGFVTTLYILYLYIFIQMTYCCSHLASNIYLTIPYQYTISLQIMIIFICYVFLSTQIAYTFDYRNRDEH